MYRGQSSAGYATVVLLRSYTVYTAMHPVVSGIRRLTEGPRRMQPARKVNDLSRCEQPHECVRSRIRGFPWLRLRGAGEGSGLESSEGWEPGVVLPTLAPRAPESSAGAERTEFDLSNPSSSLQQACTHIGRTSSACETHQLRSSSRQEAIERLSIRHSETEENGSRAEDKTGGGQCKSKNPGLLGFRKDGKANESGQRGSGAKHTAKLLQQIEDLVASVTQPKVVQFRRLSMSCRAA